MARPSRALAQCEGILPSMARVVVVLLRQCDDQPKVGSPPHTIGYRLSGESRMQV
jgi:hypothetical protein